MIGARGTLDGAAFDVTLTGRRGAPVVGSKRVRALVDAAVRSGRTVLAGPTGPRVKVDPADPVSILHLLAQETDLTATTGAPEPATEAVGVIR